jgi:hypothetical protein
MSNFESHPLKTYTHPVQGFTVRATCVLPKGTKYQVDDGDCLSALREMESDVRAFIIHSDNHISLYVVEGMSEDVYVLQENEIM